MIRACIFVAVVLGAVACIWAVLPLWPVFLALAGLLLFASWRVGNEASKNVAILVGAGIVAMTVPMHDVVQWRFAILLWSGIAYCALRHNKKSAAFICCMPIGYLGIQYGSSIAPVGAWWFIVEASGVASLLAAGGPIDALVNDFLGDLRRRFASRDLVARRLSRAKVPKG